MTRKRKSYSGEDITKLRAHSKARTPAAQVAKLLNRTVGSLQQKSRRLDIKLGHRPYDMLPKIIEHTCPGCNGTGFPKVKQPAQPGRKLYPVQCKTCAGKGKVADASN